jgi:hypothetical protein
MLLGGFALGAMMSAITATAISQHDHKHDHDHGKTVHDHATGEKHFAEHTDEHGVDMSAEQMAKMMELWQKLGSPGDMHKKLDYFAGEWTTTTRMWMNGHDAPPTETAGTSSAKWILGGRYIMAEHTGSIMGMPMEGLHIIGFDNYKNKFVNVWIDNMNTNMLYSEGLLDMTGDVLICYGAMDEWMTDQHDKAVKYVTRRVDDDTYMFEIHDLGIVPGETKVVEIEYTRVPRDG